MVWLEIIYIYKSYFECKSQTNAGLILGSHII
jgi:hypothetical protein